MQLNDGGPRPWVRHSINSTEMPDVKPSMPPHTPQGSRRRATAHPDGRIDQLADRLTDDSAVPVKPGRANDLQIHGRKRFRKPASSRNRFALRQCFRADALVKATGRADGETGKAG